MPDAGVEVVRIFGFGTLLEPESWVKQCYDSNCVSGAMPPESC